MRYFTIINNLRGCYMPGNVTVIKAKTRRELRNALAYDASDMREAYGYGGSKKAVASVAAAIWRNPKEWREFVIPFGQTKGNYPFGLSVSNATRADYLAYVAENN